jgi:hypothetical protein
VAEAFGRVDRLREELAAVRDHVRQAEAAFRSARFARERAEADAATYVDRAAELEAQNAGRAVSVAASIADQVEDKLEDFRRTRQHLAEAWTAQGSTRKSAEAVAALIFDKDIIAAEHQLQRVLIDLRQVQAKHQRLVRYEQTKRSMTLRAEVEARRARELDCQAAWEKARSRQAQIEARLARNDLSRGEQRLLDRLLVVLHQAGGAPPPTPAPPSSAPSSTASRPP